MEQVFEGGGDKHAVRRAVAAEKSAVFVDLAHLWPPQRLRWGADTPPWARAQGIRVNTPVEARLVEWVLTSCGDWLGRCELAVTVGGSQLVLDQLVPAHLIRESS